MKKILLVSVEAALLGVLALVVATTAHAATRQRVYCIGGGTKTVCETGMRLSCVLGGRTTLAHVPAAAFSEGNWRVSIGWNTGRWQQANGPTAVRSGRFSVATLLGGASPRWALATIDLPTKQVIIRTRCG